MSTSLPPELSPRASATRPQRARAQSSTTIKSPGLTLTGLIVVCLVPTAVVMLASAALFSGVGGFANLVFAVVSIFAAVRIKRSEFFAAIIAPPLIYAASLIIASGALSGKSGGLLINIGATLGTYLSVAAPWLFFVEIVCLIVIIVRGRTGR